MISNVTKRAILASVALAMPLIASCKPAGAPTAVTNAEVPLAEGVDHESMSKLAGSGAYLALTGGSRGMDAQVTLEIPLPVEDDKALSASEKVRRNKADAIREALQETLETDLSTWDRLPSDGALDSASDLCKWLSTTDHNGVLLLAGVSVRDSLGSTFQWRTDMVVRFEVWSIDDEELLFRGSHSIKNRPGRALGEDGRLSAQGRETLKDGLVSLLRKAGLVASK